MGKIREFIRFANYGTVRVLAKWVRPEKAVFPFT
jgi:hypothetical protein